MNLQSLLLAAATLGSTLPAVAEPVQVHYRTADIQGVSVFYREAGPADAPAVLLLHGFGASSHMFRELIPVLAQRYRVIAPDLPGFGESTRDEAQPYDYAAHTRRLRELMDAWGIAKAHLAGNSMGGTIAALLAQEHPDRVASVAFIGAPHGIRSARPSTMDRLIDAGQARLVAHDAVAFDAMMDLVFAQRPFLPAPILEAARADAVRDALSNLRLWHAQLKDRYLLQERIGGLRPPTLALWGQQDRVFDASGAEALRSLLPQARIETLPGLGHLPMMEAPLAVSARYGQFLHEMNAKNR